MKLAALFLALFLLAMPAFAEGPTYVTQGDVTTDATPITGAFYAPPVNVDRTYRVTIRAIARGDNGGRAMFTRNALVSLTAGVLSLDVADATVIVSSGTVTGWALSASLVQGTGTGYPRIATSFTGAAGVRVSVTTQVEISLDVASG